MAENEKQKINPDFTELDHDEVLHAWKTPEFVPLERGKTWYIIASLILLSLIAYAIWSGSATMAIVFILMGGMFFMVQNQKPRMQTIAITNLGVWIDDIFYSYSNIRSFWIVYEPPYIRTLYLQIGKGHKKISIQLNDQNPVKIRQLLTREIPEEENRHEDFTDALTRILRLH